MRFRSYFLTLLFLLCAAVKVMAVGPIPLNFDFLRGLPYRVAAELYGDWIRQLYTTKSGLLQHVSHQTHVSFLQTLPAKW